MSTPLSRKNMDLTAKWLYSSGAIHAGYDYRVDIGTPVFAVRGGHILKKVDNIKNLDPDKEGKSGDPPNYILQATMYKDEPATIVYMHVSPNVAVDEGDEVEPGDQIARSGHNGHSTGPHLHIAAVKGHRTGPFDYLHDLADNSAAPNGLASNGITIFPPRLLYKRSKTHELATGTIIIEDLEFGTMDSPSVRRLQHRLNGIHLEGGSTLPETGNYLDMTRAEVTKWQIQKRGADPGSAMADGILRPSQLKFMFGKHFKLVHQH